MFTHNLSPYILELGNLKITYYGLVYALGFLITLYFIKYQIKNKNIKNLKPDDAYDLILYIIIGSILSARLFHIIIYNPIYYLNNPLDIIAFWKGGMAFHGGLIGCIISLHLFCKKKGCRFLQIADYLSIPTSLFLAFGRIANFINAELVGKPTDVSWCVYFNKENICRHPSQIYESIKNLIIFNILTILNYNRPKKYKDGTIFFLFITLYGLFRFLVTFYRVPEQIIIGIGKGQWLSLLMFFTGLILLYNLYKKKSRGK